MTTIKLLSSTVLAASLAFFATAEQQIPTQGGRSSFFSVMSPSIPQKVNFAGQDVSFDRTDLAERLDRELTGIIYGQTMSQLIIKRANRFFPQIAPILEKNNVPLDFLYLCVAESSLDINALSPAKAAGLWQFMPETGRRYGLEVNDEIDERYNIEKATEAACKYLKESYAKYHDWPSVAASYNAGPGRITSELSKQGVSTSLDLQLVSETSRYVFRIIAYKLLMERPRDFGYTLYSRQLYQPMKYNVVEVKGPVASWISWAKSHGLTWLQLKEANPWIRSTKLTGSQKTYKVLVPTQESLYRSKCPVVIYNKNWVAD